MDIIEDIRAAFISNIGNEEWMDDETREAARRKVCASVLRHILVKSSVSVSFFLNHKLEILGIMLLLIMSFASHFDGAIYPLV